MDCYFWKSDKYLKNKLRRENNGSYTIKGTQDEEET